MPGCEKNPHGAIWPADPEAIARAGALLRRGELVAFPTETVYGLGASALDDRAVAAVFDAKGRPRFDPLIVHVPDAEAARALAAHWPASAEILAQRFWPGPLTLVLPKVSPGPGRAGVGDLVTAGLPSVGLRVPAHPVARALIQAAAVPIAAPSANRFGGVSPTRARDVADELGPAVAAILDGGPCQTGVESTVVSLVGQRPVVLRLGGVEVEAIESVLGPVAVATGDDASDPGAAAKGLASPGMLARHYAPRTPMVLVGSLASADWAALSARAGGGGIGVLSLGGAAGRTGSVRPAVERVLSAGGDLREAAAALFGAVRALDGAGLGLIVAERVPDRGLGRAINDRLCRASGRGGEPAG